MDNRPKSAGSQSAASKDTSLTHQLLAAVDEGDILKVKRLVHSAGPAVNGTNKHGESPLHIAAGYGRLNIVKLLLKYGAAINQRDKQGDTPLYWAARHGHLDVVQWLCEKGANIDSQDKSGETPLHVCARYGHPEVLAYLCRSGANLNIQDKDGDTPLLCGCWHGYQNIVECLSQAGCSLRTANKDGETPLHVAAVRGNYNIVHYLAENGAELDATDSNGCSPVHLATRRNHLDIVQYLCQKGVNLNLQDCNGDTPLHDACRQGQLSLFYTLYAAKNDLNIPNSNGATPLHLAAKYGHFEVVRRLCSAGCDLNTVTEHGFTADEVAANSGHDDLATLIHHLRQGNLRDYYVSELVLGQVPINRAKLMVCGAAGVGKTELIGSLKCHILRSLFRRRSTSDFHHMILKRTHGMTVQQAAIPNAGNFSIWDFSGMKEFYIAHENFLGNTNAIILMVFSLRDPVSKQLAQVRFWLAMIKSKHTPNEAIHHTAKVTNRPFVILVGSFFDQERPTSLDSQSSDIFAVPLASTAQASSDSGRSVLEMVSKEFGDYFDFSDVVYTMDCRLSQSYEMRSLRTLLGSLHARVVKEQPWVPTLVSTLSQSLPAWRRDHADLPVLTWSNFHLKTRAQVNPLVSEERMRVVATALHNMGEIIYINEGPLQNLVILDPNWLGVSIFGPALSPENSVHPQLHVKSVTGQVSLSEIQRVYRDWDALSIARLFEHFELCTYREGSNTIYEFPCLIKMQPLFGLWERDPSFPVYAGLYLKCKGVTDIFSPGLFSRVQVHLRKDFSDDLDDQELTLWSDGLKCCRGEVEVLVQQIEPNKTIAIFVRGMEHAGHECYAMMQQIYKMVLHTVHTTNPGTHVATHLLSSKQLREHVKSPVAFSATQVFDAEREGGVVRDPGSGLEERIVDAVCCGCEDLLITARSAPYSTWKDVSFLSRVEVCRMLDPPDPFGRDWCLLALQLGLTEEVAAIDQSDDGLSSTDKLLTVWERLVSGTIVTIIDALRGIGRDDVAEVIIEGISPFANANSSVVINVPCVTLTSYVC